MTQIIADVINDPTLPRTEDHPCPKCNHKDAVFFQSQSVRAEVSFYFHCMFYVELNKLKCITNSFFYERWKVVLIRQFSVILGRNAFVLCVSIASVCTSMDWVGYLSWKYYYIYLSWKYYYIMYGQLNLQGVLIMHSFKNYIWVVRKFMLTWHMFECK